MSNEEVKRMLAKTVSPVFSERLNRCFNVEAKHLGLFWNSKDGWKGFQDKWLIIFQTDHGAEVFDYMTGTGHRTAKKPMVCGPEKWEIDKAIKFAHGGATPKDEPENLKMCAELIVKATVPPVLKLDDILCCLVNDAQASTMSFDQWCSEFGYDNDSRKAFATYEACQKNGDKLRNLGVNIAEAQEKFQDY